MVRRSPNKKSVNRAREAAGILGDVSRFEGVLNQPSDLGDVQLSANSDGAAKAPTNEPSGLCYIPPSPSLPDRLGGYAGLNAGDNASSSINSNRLWTSPTKRARQVSNERYIQMEKEKSALENELWESKVAQQENESKIQEYEAKISKLQEDIRKAKISDGANADEADEFRVKAEELSSALIKVKQQAKSDKKRLLDRLESNDHFIEQLQLELEAAHKDVETQKQAIVELKIEARKVKATDEVAHQSRTEELGLKDIISQESEGLRGPISRESADQTTLEALTGAKSISSRESGTFELSDGSQPDVTDSISPRRLADLLQSAAFISKLSSTLDSEKLMQIAENKGYVIVDNEEYKTMAYKSNVREFNRLSIHERTAHFERIIKSQGMTKSTSSSIEMSVKKLGFVPVPHEEYQRLLSSQKEYVPTKGDVMRAAKLFDMVIVSTDDYNRLRSASSKSPPRSPQRSPQRSQAPLPSDGFSTPLRSVDYESPSSIRSRSLTDIQTPGSVAPPSSRPVSAAFLEVFGPPKTLDDFSDAEIVSRAQRLGYSHLSREEIIERAKGYGLSESLGDNQILERAKDLGLVEPLDHQTIVQAARNLGLVDPPDDTQIIQRAREIGLVDRLSEQDILHSAKLLGLIEPLSTEEILHAARQLGLQEPMTDAMVLARAKALGLVNPPTNDDIVKHAQKMGLKRPATADETLQEAFKLGLVQPLSDDEIVQAAKLLGLTTPLTDDQIKANAQALGLVEPYTDQQIKERAGLLGLRMPLSELEIKERAKQLGLQEPLTDDQVRSKGIALGLVLPLSDEDVLARALALGLTSPLNVAQILEKARQHGLVDALSDDEILAAAKQLGLTERLTTREIEDQAKALGFEMKLTESEIVEAAKGLGLREPLSKDEIISQGKDYGLIEPLSTADILDRALALGLRKPLTEDEVISEARNIGMTWPLSGSEIIAQAKNFGMVERQDKQGIIDLAKSLGLVEPLGDDEIRAKAVMLGMREPYNDEEILAKARSLGYAELLSEDEILVRARALGLTEPLNEGEICEHAKSLGMLEPVSIEQILVKARENGLVDPLNDAEIITRAKVLGMIEQSDRATICSLAISFGLSEPMDGSRIRAEAARLGMVSCSDDDRIRSLARDLGLQDPLSDLEIVDKARSIGLTEPLSDIEIKTKAASLGMVSPMNEEEIRAQAQKLGMTEPMSSSQIVNAAKLAGLVEPLTDDEIINRAHNFGLVEALSNEDIVVRAKSLGLIEPDDDTIIAKAMQLGFAAKLNDDEIIEHAKKLSIKKSQAEVATPLFVKSSPSFPAETKQTILSPGNLPTVPLSHEIIVQRIKELNLDHPFEQQSLLDMAAELLGTQSVTFNDLITMANLCSPHGILDDLVAFRKLITCEHAETIFPDVTGWLDFILEAAHADPLDTNEKTVNDLQISLPQKGTEIMAKITKLGISDTSSNSEILTRFRVLYFLDVAAQIDAIRSQISVEKALPESSLVKESAPMLKPSDEDVLARAKDLGLIEPLSDDEIIEMAMGLGLAIPLTDDAIIAKARYLTSSCKSPVASISEDETVKSASALKTHSSEDADGTAAVEEDDELNLLPHEACANGPQGSLSNVETTSLSGASEYLKGTDDTNGSSSRSSLLIDPGVRSEDTSAASGNGSETKPEILSGISSLGTTEGEAVTGPGTGGHDTAEIRIRDETISNFSDAKSPLTEDELRTKALEIGLVKPLTEEEIVSKAKALGLTHPMTADEIISKAKSLGLIDPVETSHPAESMKMGHATTTKCKDTPNSASYKDDLRIIPSTVASVPPDVSGSTEKDRLDWTYQDAMRLRRRRISKDQEEETIERKEREQLVPLDAIVSTNYYPDLSVADTVGKRVSSKMLQETNSRPESPRLHDSDAEDEHDDVENIGYVDSDVLAAVDTDFIIHDASSADNCKKSVGLSLDDRSSQRDDAASLDKQLVLAAPFNPTAETAFTQHLAECKRQPTIPRSLVSTNLNSKILPRSPTSELEAESVSHLSSPPKQTGSIKYSPRRSVRRYQVRNTSQSRQSSLRSGSRLNTLDNGTNTDLKYPRKPGSLSGSARSPSLGAPSVSLSHTDEQVQLFLSQLIVGEVLYKYTSGLTIEGITGGRHKRYFWFRPDSCTLYWTRENPQIITGLYGSARSVTVHEVEDIFDGNPLPVALHYRTILIRGVERDLRVTCQTQGRHTIWFEGLKYFLAHRQDR